MYAWKCWLDTRVRFLSFLISLAILISLSAVTSSLDWRPGSGWSLGHGGLEWVSDVWKKTIVGGLLLWGAGITALASLSLGASGLSEEFATGTIQFLLTRPKPRSHFVWTGWAVGICELLVIVLIGMTAGFGTLVVLTGRVYTWRILGMVPFLFAWGAVLYGLTYLMAVLTRDGRNGVIYSLLLTFVYIFSASGAHRFWRVHVPSLFDLLGNYKWVMESDSRFPAASLLGWISVAVIFPVFTQLAFERAEV